MREIKLLSQTMLLCHEGIRRQTVHMTAIVDGLSFYQFFSNAKENGMDGERLTDSQAPSQCVRLAANESRGFPWPVSRSQ